MYHVKFMQYLIKLHVNKCNQCITVKSDSWYGHDDNQICSNEEYPYNQAKPAQTRIMGVNV